VPRWSFTKNHHMMHGQQNVKLCLDLFFFCVIFFVLVSDTVKVWPVLS